MIHHWHDLVLGDAYGLLNIDHLRDGDLVLEAALARDIDALLAAHETHIRNTVGILRRQLRFDQDAQ
ncbi:MAG: hypothetical protein H6990_10995 [Pseudomonadales bacterium]|nr:hypothetical protein [Pseudomonadales bacterium]